MLGCPNVKSKRRRDLQCWAWPSLPRRSLPECKTSTRRHWSLDWIRCWSVFTQASSLDPGINHLSHQRRAASTELPGVNWFPSQASLAPIAPSRCYFSMSLMARPTESCSKRPCTSCETPSQSSQTMCYFT